MRTIIPAYVGLLEIAARGREFTAAETEGIAVDDDRSVVGTGFKFTGTIDVPDLAKGQTVPGEATLVVVATGMDTLYLDSSLQWTALGMFEHASRAWYEISFDDALEMARGAGDDYDDDTEPIGFSEAMTNIIVGLGGSIDHTVGPHHQIGQWRQTYPGLGQSHPGAEIARAATDAQAYHERAVFAVQRGNPMICMLTGYPVGFIADWELPDLYRWVRSRPEIQTQRSSS